MKRKSLMALSLCPSLILLGSTLSVPTAAAQGPAFAVATIRPSGAPVQFEHDGKTETWPGTLNMRDVTVATCIKWAYGVQDSQISGPDWLQSTHFDITAKADEPVAAKLMKPMLQTLLAERFKLKFHRENKELKAFALTVAKSGQKLHESASEEAESRENSANGTVAKSTTMREFADFISGPLQKPVVDKTGLTGRYDFVLDFTSYLPEDMATMRPDATGVIITALEGELGLKLEPRKELVEVMVVDHVEKPSEN